MALNVVDSILELSKRPFLDLAPDIAGSLLYLDAGAGEVAHSCLGLPFLFGIGAANVCALEHAHADDGLLLALSGQPTTQLTILTTQLLTNVHQHILQALLAHPLAQSVLILSSVSEHAHALQAATDLGVEAFSEYADMLKRDVDQHRTSAAATVAAAAGRRQPPGVPPADLAVAVRAFPLHMCAIDASTFVLPAASGAASSARAGGVAAGWGPADASVDADGEGASGGLSLLAHALLGIVAQIGGGGRLEVHALGPVALQIAQEVSTTPLPAVPSSSQGAQHQQQQQHVRPSVGLILVDRSLDLLAPCTRSDHLVDRMVAGLSCATSTDVPPLSAEPPSANGSSRVTWRPLVVRADVQQLAPGRCPLPVRPSFGVELFNPTDRAAGQRLEHLLARKPREAALLLRKMIREAMRAEAAAGVTQAVRPRAGAVTAAELHMLAECIVAGGEACLMRQRGVAMLGLTAPYVLGPSPVAERWEAAGGLEKALLAALAGQGGAEDAARVLVDALSGARHGKGLVRLPDLLTLLALAHSVVLDATSANDPDERHAASHLEAALAALGGGGVLDALVAALQAASAEDLEQLPGIRRRLQEGGSSADGGVSGKVAGQVANEVMRRLRYVGGARARLHDLRRVTTGGDLFADEVATAPNPLLRQLVRRILQQADLKDLAQPTSSSALRGVLKNVFGGMMAAAAKAGGVGGVVGGGGGAGGASKLHECNVLLLFVVGGLSIAEVREVRQELDGFAGSRPQVLLAGTALLTPLEVARQMTA